MTPPPTQAPEPDDDAPTASPASAPSMRRRDRLAWRVGTPAVLLLSGALFVVSGVNSEGTDLRPGRYTDLASLVEADSAKYEDLKDQSDALADEVDLLRGRAGGTPAEKIQRRADRMRDPAGLEPRSGPGVSVVMSDAPRDVLEAALDSQLNLNRFVVHQQDIQAVVNAMWAGGASAITIQGQRVVTTTCIKCEGNAVQLQGAPYPQPYTIEAVGDPAALAASIDADPDVTKFRGDADRADIAVGWDFELEDQVEAPAYDGLLDISSARPLRNR